jgi:hypothetical protein
VRVGGTGRGGGGAEESVTIWLMVTLWREQGWLTIGRASTKRLQLR